MFNHVLFMVFGFLGVMFDVYDVVVLFKEHVLWCSECVGVVLFGTMKNVLVIAFLWALGNDLVMLSLFLTCF